MSNTVKQCRKSKFGINPDVNYWSGKRFHRLNPEMIFELKEESLRKVNFPCDNSDYTPNKFK